MKLCPWLLIMIFDGLQKLKLACLGNFSKTASSLLRFLWRHLLILQGPESTRHKHLNFAFRLLSPSFLSFLFDCSNSSIWILPQCRHTFVITFSQASKLTHLNMDWMYFIRTYILFRCLLKTSQTPFSPQSVLTLHTVYIHAPIGFFVASRNWNTHR